MTSILSIGILCDDQDKINEAILYFKYGVGNGSIDNAVPFLHQDPDGHGVLGQGQESGRDQGHATLCIALMGAFCQMAYNIGEDLLLIRIIKYLLWQNTRLSIIYGKTLMIGLLLPMRNLCIAKRDSLIVFTRTVVGNVLRFLPKKK